jgi:citrate lyase subunit beta / citryl-CoA lyase
VEVGVSVDWLFRSLLFCPANEPRKIARLARSAADAVVLDLEDAVADAHKIAARGTAREALSALDGVTRCVRVNSFETGLTVGDVAAVVCAELDAIVLPKAETVQDIRRLDRLIARAEATNGVAAGAVRVIAIVETCAGIAAAAELAGGGSRLCRIVFGAGDLAADLGLPTIRGDLSAALAYGRAKIVYAARAAGLPPPVDGPYLHVRDLAGFARDSETARALGHGGRLCLHPDQVPVVNRIFSPDAEEVAFARKLIAAFAEAEGAGSASITVDGVFVDYPIARKARHIVALADAIAAREAGRSHSTGDAAGPSSRATASAGDRP